jgi:hypothetical protein
MERRGNQGKSNYIAGIVIKLKRNNAQCPEMPFHYLSLLLRRDMETKEGNEAIPTRNDSEGSRAESCFLRRALISDGIAIRIGTSAACSKVLFNGAM